VNTHKALELLEGVHDCALHTQLVAGDFVCLYCGQPQL